MEVSESHWHPCKCGPGHLPWFPCDGGFGPTLHAPHCPCQDPLNPPEEGGRPHYPLASLLLRKVKQKSRILSPRGVGKSAQSRPQREHQQETRPLQGPPQGPSHQAGGRPPTGHSEALIVGMLVNGWNHPNVSGAPPERACHSRHWWGSGWPKSHSQQELRPSPAPWPDRLSFTVTTGKVLQRLCSLVWWLGSGRGCGGTQANREGREQWTPKYLGNRSPSDHPAVRKCPVCPPAFKAWSINQSSQRPGKCRDLDKSPHQRQTRDKCSRLSFGQANGCQPQTRPPSLGRSHWGYVTSPMERRPLPFFSPLANE